MTLTSTIDPFVKPEVLDINQTLITMSNSKVLDLSPLWCQFPPLGKQLDPKSFNI